MERGKFRRVRNGMDCSEESPLFLKTISKKLDFRKTGREVSALKNTPRSYPRGDEGGMELGKEFPEDSLERFLLEPLIRRPHLRLGLGVS